MIVVSCWNSNIEDPTMVEHFVGSICNPSLSRASARVSRVIIKVYHPL